MPDQRWIFVVRALDKPGTLTATAATFSNRGVSLESILASGIAPTTLEEGRLILIFRATRQKKDLLQRTLERLSFIFQVESYTYEDERLRAIAVARLTRSVEVDPHAHYSVETIAQTESGHIVMLTGAPSVVETAISNLRTQGDLKDVVISYITV